MSHNTNNVIEITRSKRATETVRVNIAALIEERYGYYHPEFLCRYDEKTDTASILHNAENYRLIIEHLYPSLRFSEFDDRIYMGNEPMTDFNQHEIRGSVIRFLQGRNIALNEIKEIINYVANRNSFNPLAEWFDGLPPVPLFSSNHLDNWLTTIAGVKDTPLTRVLGRKWLISAVARAYDPGCYVEGSLILFGPQAAGKTWLFRNLNPKAEWYCGSNVDISNVQKATIDYRGKFIIEFGELSSLSRATLEDVKNYLTTQVDVYTPKFSNIAKSVPRQMLFGGTTNDPNVLLDSTGNRRFWVVEVGSIDQKRFLAIKTELWAEAKAAYQAGERWTLTEDERALLERENAIFETDDPLADHMLECLNLHQGDTISAAEAKRYADRLTARVSPQTISKLLTKLGWQRIQVSKGPNKGRVAYRRPQNDGAIDWSEVSE